MPVPAAVREFIWPNHHQLGAAETNVQNKRICHQVSLWQMIMLAKTGFDAVESSPGLELKVTSCRGSASKDNPNHLPPPQAAILDLMPEFDRKRSFRKRIKTILFISQKVLLQFLELRLSEMCLDKTFLCVLGPNRLPSKVKQSIEYISEDAIHESSSNVQANRNKIEKAVMRSRMHGSVLTLFGVAAESLRVKAVDWGPGFGTVLDFAGFKKVPFMIAPQINCAKEVDAT